MKKLRLDDLTIESFATSPRLDATRGTVIGHRTAMYCAESWNGTCWVSCQGTCADYETCAEPCPV